MPPPPQPDQTADAPLDEQSPRRAVPPDAQAALHLAQRLQLAMAASDMGDYLWDPRTDAVAVSPKIRELFGLPPDEPATREAMRARLHPADADAAQQRLQAALATGTDYDAEYRVRRPDGSVVWVATRGRFTFDQHGNVAHLLGVMQDVTRRRLAEDSLRDELRFNETLRTIGASLTAKLDLQELLQAITDAGTQISRAQFGAFFYNVPADAAGGETYTLYTISGVPREHFSKFPMPRKTAVFGPTFDGQGIVRSDDITKDHRYGHSAPYHGMPQGHLPVRSYLAAPVKGRDGSVIGGLFFGHADTAVFTPRDERFIEGIAAHAALALDNARLYDAERRARAEAERANRDKDHLLESERAARAEAERTNRLKDEFLATVSHELRTPLNAILGWSQLLNEHADPETLRNGTDVIRRNARAQAQLIEDLLDMSRIISGKIRLDVQPVDLADVVAVAVESVRHAADAKSVRLTHVVDPAAGPVQGDPARLQQVLWNLLSNAIKFTPRAGNVQVTLRRTGTHLELVVADSGAGIPADFLPHVFERFRQADASTTRKYGGLGLGLSIVKSLVEMHGGTVRAQSPGPGQGATFTVILPVLSVAGTQRVPAALDNLIASPALRNLRILVVDDEPDARALIKRLLAESGADVTTAGSAADALAAFHAADPPELLISDIGMPDRDGYDLIRAVRSLPPDRGGRTPAIALTAFARSEDRTRAMLAGYQLHLPKPVEPPELLAAAASLAYRT